MIIPIAADVANLFSDVEVAALTATVDALPKHAIPTYGIYSGLSILLVERTPQGGIAISRQDLSVLCCGDAYGGYIRDECTIDWLRCLGKCKHLTKALPSGRKIEILFRDMNNPHCGNEKNALFVLGDEARDDWIAFRNADLSLQAFFNLVKADRQQLELGGRCQLQPLDLLRASLN